jgi:predicted metal-dependent hydrolase
MKVRYPKWDYAETPPHWSPYIEYVAARNAASTIPSYVEPYVVKVMVMARAAINKRDTPLDQDIVTFIKQENQHCKQHDAFNRRLHEEGYEGLKAFEEELENELEVFLETKSLRFHCAWADGFESMGAAMGQAIFEGRFAEFDAEEPNPGNELWRWHMAEEFEHRSVCYDVYHELFVKKTPIRGYFYRLYGFFFAVKHLGGYSKRVAKYLLDVDRSKMTPEELQASIAREKHFKKVYAKIMIPRMLRVLSPFYNPKNLKTPPELTHYLENFGERGRLAFEASAA